MLFELHFDADDNWFGYSDDFFSFCKSFLFITFFLAAAPLFHTVSTRSKKKIYARRGVVIEKFTFCEHYVSDSMTFEETLVHHCHHDFKQF